MAHRADAMGLLSDPGRAIAEAGCKQEDISTGKTMVADDDAPTLPSPETKRWTVAHKAAVIEGVRQGLLTIEEACQRYNLTMDEYRAWERDFDSHGRAGLRATRVGIYRKAPRTR